MAGVPIRYPSQDPWLKSQQIEQTRQRMTSQQADQAVAADQNAFTRGQRSADFGASLNDFSKFADRFGSFGTASAPPAFATAPATGMLSGYGSLSGGGAIPAAPTLDTASIDAADRAAYSRAKDTVGQETGGALKSLRNAFAARGMGGSSIEGRQIGSAIDAGAGRLADVDRSQAEAAGGRAVDLAKTKYQGDLTTRGQDVNASTAFAGIAANGTNAANALALQRWQAEQSNALAKQQAMLGLWGAFKGMY